MGLAPPPVLSTSVMPINRPSHGMQDNDSLPKTLSTFASNTSSAVHDGLIVLIQNAPTLAIALFTQALEISKFIATFLALKYLANSAAWWTGIPAVPPPEVERSIARQKRAEPAYLQLERIERIILEQDLPELATPKPEQPEQDREEEEQTEQERFQMEELEQLLLELETAKQAFRKGTPATPSSHDYDELEQVLLDWEVMERELRERFGSEQGLHRLADPADSEEERLKGERRRLLEKMRSFSLSRSVTPSPSPSLDGDDDDDEPSENETVVSYTSREEGRTSCRVCKMGLDQWGNLSDKPLTLEQKPISHLPCGHAYPRARVDL